MTLGDVADDLPRLPVGLYPVEVNLQNRGRLTSFFVV